MSHKKALPDDVERFFDGESIFFAGTPAVKQPAITPSPHVSSVPDQSTAARTPTGESLPKQADEQPQDNAFLPAQQEFKATHSPASPMRPSPTHPSHDGEKQTVHESDMQATMTDGMHDVMTSQLTGVNLKAWQAVIEDTETQNSALRLTSTERYAVEDVVNELRRQEKIKTSMNEIARLGLLLLIHDFKQNKRRSLLYQVKQA